MPTTAQRATQEEVCFTSRPVTCLQEMVTENPQASYYRARYYNPQLQRFVSEDPLRYGGGGPTFYAYVHDNPVNLSDPFGLTDYNEQQTLQLFLQPAYTDATAGFFKGLGNIFDHSRGYQGVPGQGDYDFGWNEHQNDTFTRCGVKMTAAEFGNYMAGFETGGWDDAFYGDREIGFSLNHLWQLRYAEMTARMAGLFYHNIRGQTQQNDRLAETGWPFIALGANDGRTFSKNGGMTGRGCGCN